MTPSNEAALRKALADASPSGKGVVYVLSQIDGLRRHGGR